MPCSHLVVFRGGDEEEDGGDRVETLEPAPPLRPLPSHVHHLEGNILDLKVILVDALGGFTGQQDVLLSGEVTLEEGRKHNECLSTSTGQHSATHQQLKEEFVSYNLAVFLFCDEGGR